MQWIGYIGIGILVLLVLLVLVTNIQIVQQSRAYVVERLGAYSATWGVGLHFKIPFFERVVKKVSLKEQVADFDPQPVITKDNVTMQIDTVIYFQITDPKLYTSSTSRSRAAMSSTPRCALSSMRPPTRGASRSTAWSSRTSCRRVRSRTRWKSR